MLRRMKKMLAATLAVLLVALNPMQSLAGLRPLFAFWACGFVMSANRQRKE
jgi:hypothetical protein